MLAADSVRMAPAAPDDADPLAELFVVCFNAPPWNEGWTLDGARERLRAILSGASFRGRVAWSAGVPVAMVLGNRERWARGYHLNIVEMCVTPALQRSGLGGELLRSFENGLLSEGIQKVYVLTAPDSPASAFYRKYGFSPSRGRIVMTRALNPEQP